MRSSIEALLAREDPSALARAEEDLDRALGRPPRPLVLVGSGEVGRCTWRVLRREGLAVACFADSDPLKWESTCEGLPVVSPARAVELAGPEAAFVVTWRASPAAFEREKARLARFGAREVLPLSLLLRRWPEISGWAGQPPRYYVDHADAILRAYDLLADDESRRQFEGHLRWRLLRDYEALPEGDLADQYFVDGLVRLLPDERFVDAGAFDGDTIRALFWRSCEKFGHVHAFEPDPASYAGLERFVGRLPPALRAKITTSPLAVSDGPGEVRFTALGSHSSFIGGAEATRAVKTVALDDALGDEKVTFLKLDLEGAERPALAGAERLLARHRPLVALAVYHRPSDLFELPVRLAEKCGDYRFHLRSHNSYGLDLVLYAVPAGR